MCKVVCGVGAGLSAGRLAPNRPSMLAENDTAPRWCVTASACEAAPSPSARNVDAAAALPTRPFEERLASLELARLREEFEDHTKRWAT